MCSVVSDIFDKLPKDDAQARMEARSHAEEEYERLRREIERLEKELAFATQEVREWEKACDVVLSCLADIYNDKKEDIHG